MQTQDNPGRPPEQLGVSIPDASPNGGRAAPPGPFLTIDSPRGPVTLEALGSEPFRVCAPGGREEIVADGFAAADARAGELAGRIDATPCRALTTRSFLASQGGSGPTYRQAGALAPNQGPLEPRLAGLFGARPVGVEPTTSRSGGERSIH